MGKVSVETLHDLLSLDATTGVLTWKRRPEIRSADKTFNGKFAGRVAGCLRSDGYVTVWVAGRAYQAHLIVWAMVNGRWPAEEVDHRDGVGNHNAPENLREATRPEQQQNLKKNKRNTSGFMGVTWDSQRRKWRAKIAIDHKDYDLGRFDTPEEAAEAYKVAKAKLHTFQPKARES